MIRRHSSTNRSASPEKTVTKTKSANDLSVPAAERPAIRFSPSSFDNLPSESDFSTLKDPRLRGSNVQRSVSAPHPDLNSEITTLSAKLVQAINNQTVLDDTLVATRHELNKDQATIQTLEMENAKYRNDIANKVLIRKADADLEIMKLNLSLAHESAQRANVEQGKRNIEQELETLTAALFEEANKVWTGMHVLFCCRANLLQMVAAAKKERDAAERKNDQLRAQIRDTELLLVSHQEQLAELKTVMQEMSPSNEELDSQRVLSPLPPTPASPERHSSTGYADAQDTTLETAGLSPGPATSFPQFIQTVCRTDFAAYNDFHDLLIQSTIPKSSSRTTGGSYISSITGGGPSTPNGNSPASSGNSHIPLKDTRFYKRTVTEDIEPTLRLDTSPSISWLARRNIMGSVCDGSLVVEPLPSDAKKSDLPCSLCGERRDDSENDRTHRFRTSENESAQRYPLCILCLEKVRSCCDFTGFLRLILDGHIRCDDVQEEKDAWEESIRLRERMFWARMGAGVVPIFVQNRGDKAREGSQPEMTPARDVLSAPNNNADKASSTGATVEQSNVDSNDRTVGDVSAAKQVEPTTLSVTNVSDESEKVETEKEAADVRPTEGVVSHASDAGFSEAEFVEKNEASTRAIEKDEAVEVPADQIIMNGETDYDGDESEEEMFADAEGGAEEVVEEGTETAQEDAGVKEDDSTEPTNTSAHHHRQSTRIGIANFDFIR